MPRKPRTFTVVEGYQVLKTWRGHNKEFNICKNSDRTKYLGLLQKKIEKQNNVIHAFVIMGNHTHEIYSIKDNLSFSNLMRDHHARYGAYFNKKNKRCGKVAQDRPHTGQIENDQQAMTATFYIIANPIRVGIVRDPKNYLYSCYNFYAFGKQNKLFSFLEYPDWYLNLASDQKMRQRKFRKLFFAYLREYGLIKQNYSHCYYIGSIAWVLIRKEEVKKIFAKTKSPP